MSIPHRDNGYSFEPDTLIVHERYQDHAPNAHRTRSMAGILNREIQTGTKATPCEVCFPAPKRTGRVTRWQPEPEATTPEVVAEPEPEIEAPTSTPVDA